MAPPSSTAMPNPTSAATQSAAATQKIGVDRSAADFSGGERPDSLASTSTTASWCTTAASASTKRAEMPQNMT